MGKHDEEVKKLINFSAVTFFLEVTVVNFSFLVNQTIFHSKEIFYNFEKV